jgi:hypothetical protein
MCLRCDAQELKISMAVDASELLLRLQNPGGRRAQNHLPVPLPLDVAGHGPSDRNIDSIGLVERQVHVRLGLSRRRLIVAGIAMAIARGIANLVLSGAFLAPLAALSRGKDREIPWLLPVSMLIRHVMAFLIIGLVLLPVAG